MAIQEYTDTINDINITSTKYAIILNESNEIVDEIIKGGINIATPEKVVVGTRLQINNYIIDIFLVYSETPLPRTEELWLLTQIYL